MGYISFTLWPSSLFGVTFVSCIFDDLIDQFLLVVRSFHLTETTETAISIHPLTSEADVKCQKNVKARGLGYLTWYSADPSSYIRDQSYS